MTDFPPKQTAPPPLLSLRDIGKSYPTPAGEVQVLQGVNLDLHSQEFVAFTGPSGSGKTTLLNIAALMDPPSSGRLQIDGREVPIRNEGLRRRLRRDAVGMVFQKFCLLPHRSALDNVLFRCRYMPRHQRQNLKRRALDVLDRFGLAESAWQPARLLSGGEMQRVAIARAVLHPPRLLVADEPTGNLDRESAATVMEHLAELNREGITILLVTHNESLLPYCSRHVRCQNGRVVEAASA